MIRWFFRLIELGIMLVVLFSLVWLAGFVTYRLPGPLMADKIIVIEAGKGSEGIADQLLAEGIIRGPKWFFLAAITVTGQRGILKAGEYEFTPGQRMAEVVRKLAIGEVVVHKITIIEGSTVFAAMEQIRTAEGLSGPMPPAPPEGTLFPDTYFFSRGDSRLVLVTRMQEESRKALHEIWADRNENLPPEISNESALLTIASIVEKETAVPAERERIAGVFANRLRRNMKLQSDPTVVYALTNGQRELGRELNLNDLQTQSPYNTYVAPALPPGPICIPSRASLRAAAHPEVNDYFYFVANGRGGHAFAKDLAEHNQNVLNWRRIQSEERLRQATDGRQGQ